MEFNSCLLVIFFFMLALIISPTFFFTSINSALQWGGVGGPDPPPYPPMDPPTPPLKRSFGCASVAELLMQASASRG